MYTTNGGEWCSERAVRGRKRGFASGACRRLPPSSDGYAEGNSMVTVEVCDGYAKRLHTHTQYECMCVYIYIHA